MKIINFIVWISVSHLLDRALGLSDTSELSDLSGQVLGLWTESGLVDPRVGRLGLTLFTAGLSLARLGLAAGSVEGLALARRAASLGGAVGLATAGTTGLATSGTAGLTTTGIAGLDRAAAAGLARAAAAGLARARAMGLARVREWFEGAGLIPRGLDVWAGVIDRSAVSVVSSSLSPEVEAPFCWLVAISSNPELFAG